MSPSQWLSDPPLEVAQVDPSELEIRVRVRAEPSGLYTGVPVVMTSRSSRRTTGYLLAWGKRPGDRYWRYLLAVWPDRSEDYRGRQAWKWRSAWCVFEARRVRPASRSETVQGGAAYNEGLSVAIRQAMPPGHELAPGPRPI